MSAADQDPRPANRRGVRRPTPTDDALAVQNAMQRKSKTVLSQQCTARSKRTGLRCTNWAMKAQRTCRMHGGATRKARVAAAARIAESSGYAAELLTELMQDPKVDLTLRVKIAQDLLTRAGVEEAKRVQVDAGNSWLDILPRVFHDMPDEDVVDAEVLELAASPVPPADSDAARSAYLATKNAPAPMPPDAVQRVDGPTRKVRRR